jgi:hypothetical protein
MSGGELHAMLEGLRRRGWTGGAAFSGLVITGTGFYGPERAAVRELSNLCGLTYSGDLVNGLTTHLVLAAAAAGGAAPGAGRKAGKAADWGIPIVRLAWLLDSIAAQRPQPVEPYLLPHQSDGRTGERQQYQQAAAPPGQQGAAAGSCHQLLLRHRPSSVASNAPPGAAAAASGVQAEQQHAAGCSPGGQAWQQQEQQQRAALAPVGNLLADQLRRMSISPEPLPQQHSAAAQPHHHQQQQQWLPYSPPADSPQHSLSMRGMVGAALAAAAAAPGSAGSPAEVTSVAAQLAATAESPAGFSPMQQSPAASHQQQLQEQERGAGSSGEHPAPPFTISLAAALGRSLSEEAGGGSPMAESPASAAGGDEARPPSRPAAALGRSPSEEPCGGSPMVESPASTAAGVSAARPRSRLGVTPVSAQMGSEQEEQCTLPTPACIRDWSEDDDDSSSGSSAAGSPAAGARPMAAASGEYHCA